MNYRYNDSDLRATYLAKALARNLAAQDKATLFEALQELLPRLHQTVEEEGRSAWRMKNDYQALDILFDALDS